VSDARAPSVCALCALCGRGPRLPPPRAFITVLRGRAGRAVRAMEDEVFELRAALAAEARRTEAAQGEIELLAERLRSSERELRREGLQVPPCPAVPQPSSAPRRTPPGSPHGARVPGGNPAQAGPWACGTTRLSPPMNSTTLQFNRIPPTRAGGGRAAGGAGGRAGAAGRGRAGAGGAAGSARREGGATGGAGVARARRGCAGARGRAGAGARRARGRGTARVARRRGGGARRGARPTPLRGRGRRGEGRGWCGQRGARGARGEHGGCSGGGEPRAAQGAAAGGVPPPPPSPY